MMLGMDSRSIECFARGSRMTDPVNINVNDSHRSRLHFLVDEAQVLMDRLCDISQQQSQAIEAGEVEQIIEIVTIREPVIRNIVRVGEEIGAFIQDPDSIKQVDRVQRDEALNRIASIEHAMKRLRERDANDQILMEKVRDAMADQLAGLGNGKNALQAYAARPNTPNPILQDREG
jgi:flagellar biosynthesis/type III secretory pathway chaperone